MQSFPTFYPFSMVLCSPFHCSCGSWGWHTVFLEQKDGEVFVRSNVIFVLEAASLSALGFTWGCFTVLSQSPSSSLAFSWSLKFVQTTQVSQMWYVVFPELEAVGTSPAHNYLRDSSGHEMQRILERRKLLITAVSQYEASHVLQVIRATGQVCCSLLSWMSLHGCWEPLLWLVILES